VAIFKHVEEAIPKIARELPQTAQPKMVFFALNALSTKIITLGNEHILQIELPNIISS